MYISHYKEIFNTMGILWSSSKEISKELIIRMSLNYKVKEITIFNLKEKYKEFIFDCYRKDEEVMSDGYINEKIERLLDDKCNQIVAFSIDIENPEYRYNTTNNKFQCIQARAIKEQLRKEYSSKVNNYFLDNIIHLADNNEETELLKTVFHKYKNFAVKRYIRKGEKTYINGIETTKNTSYLGIVNSIDSQEER